MKIKTKVFLIAFLIAFFTIILGGLLLRFHFLNEFLKIEDIEAQRKLEISKSLIERKIEDISSSTKDWAFWDDTYYFVLGREPDYIQSNINFSTIENLDINFVAYLNNKKEIFYTFGIDRQNKKEKSFLSVIRDFSSNKNFNTQNSYEGLFISNSSIFIISSQPILKSDKTGPPVGNLIFGRILDEDYLKEKVANVVGLPLSVKEEKNSEDFSFQFQRKGFAVLRKNQNILYAYLPLNDIFGEKKIILEAEIKRDILKEGIKIFLVFFALIAICALLALIIFVVFVEKSIFQKLENLTLLFKKAKITKEPVYLSTFFGNDEIDFLAKELKKTFYKKKFSKEEISEVEEEYRKIFEVSPEAIAVVEKSGKILDVNDRVFDWLGYKKEEVVGKNILMIPFLSRKSKLIAMQKLAQRMAGKEVPFYDLEFITKNGEKKIGRVRGAVLEDQKGKREKEIVLIEDITELKKAEERLKESEENYRRIFQSAQDGIFTLDLKGRFLDGNKKAEEISGYKKEELIGKHFVKLLPKNEIKKVIAIFNNMVFGKIGFHKTEINIRRKDGNIVPIELVGNVIKKQNKIIGIEGIARDISERKKAEMALKKAKETLEIEKTKIEEILENIGEGLIVFDKEEKIMVFNKGASELLGFSREEMLGKKFSDKISIKDENGNLISLKDEPFNRAKEGRKVVFTSLTTKYFFPKKDKTLLPVSIILSPFIFKGEILGDILIFNDASTEKEIDKEKTEFVSLASHQLRTPLTTIKWYTETLLSGDLGKLEKTQKEYLTDVLVATERMIKLIRDLLNVSRLEIGTFLIEPQKFRIEKLAEEVLEEFSLIVKQKEIKLEKNYDRKLPLMFSDPRLLKIVFQNLVSNAIKYTPRGGKIVLSILKRSGDKILIEVSDNGVGIPKKDQSKIFTKLYRGDNIKMIDPEGTGLGLYLTKGIVEALLGKIWFESEENVGTTFFVLLPIKAKKKEGTKKFEEPI